MNVRALVRTHIPGSTQFYEESRIRRKSRSTPKKVQALLAQGQPIKLDIGAGDLERRGWITLDITDNCDLFWDLRRGIPFPPNSVDVVYSSHLFEHMDYAAGQALLKEVHRVLVPGGLVSVCVPNARLYIDAYLGVRDLSPDHDFWGPALHSRNGINLLNYIAYMGDEHKCLFDEQSLVERLEDSGFMDVEVRKFDAEIDLPEREYESIYAQATKG